MALPPYDRYGRDGDDEIHCAFCGKTPSQVNSMISGPNGVCICDECISICAEAMMRDINNRGGQHPFEEEAPYDDEELDETPDPAEVLANLPTPHELYDSLSEFVVGQEDAKRALSVAVYNHY